MFTKLLPDTSTRAERATSPAVNAVIHGRDNAEIARYETASPEEISERIWQLETEWDVERTLQANASTLSLIGVVLGLRSDRRFLLLPAVVFGFFLEHALQGWCPPLPLLRRLGVRTQREIDREKYALKALRGDFDDVAGVQSGEAQARVQAVLRAIDR